MSIQLETANSTIIIASASPVFSTIAINAALDGLGLVTQDQLAESPGVSFVSRNEFKQWLPGKLAGLPDGAIISAAGVQYEVDSTSTVIFDLLGVKPSGDIRPDHWRENEVPGTTGMTFGWQSAVDYADTLALYPETPGEATIKVVGVKVTGMGAKYAMNSDGTYCVDMRGLTNVLVQGAEFIAAGGGWGTAVWDSATSTWSGIIPLFNCESAVDTSRTQGVQFSNCLIRCEHLAAGVLFDKANRCAMTDVVIYGQVGYGIQSTTKHGGFHMTRVVIHQFEWGETGFEDQNNRTADGFILNTADFHLTDSSAAYCRYPLVRHGGKNGQVVGFHPYNGALTTVTGEVYNIFLPDATGTVFTNLYLDSGSIYINGANVDGLKFIGGRFSKGQNTSYFDIHTDAASTTLSGLTIAHFAGTELAGAATLSTSGAGAYSSHLLWHVSDIRTKTGTVQPGFPDVSLPGALWHAAGVHYFPDAVVIEIDQFAGNTTSFRSNRGLVFSADHAGTSGGTQSRIEFATDGVTHTRIDESGFLTIGLGQGSGGNNAAKLLWNGSGDFSIAPNSDQGAELVYDVSADVWKTEVPLVLPQSTVAGLPAAGTAGAGARAFVTDATSITFADPAAGGGTNFVPVYSNGTNWSVG